MWCPLVQTPHFTFPESRLPAFSGGGERPLLSCAEWESGGNFLQPIILFLAPPSPHFVRYPCHQSLILLRLLCCKSHLFSPGPLLAQGCFLGSAKWVTSPFTYHLPKLSCRWLLSSLCLFLFPVLSFQGSFRGRGNWCVCSVRCLLWSRIYLLIDWIQFFPSSPSAIPLSPRKVYMGC